MTAATATAFDFDEIYQTHYHRVFSICLKMLHNVHDAEDLTQETFIQVARKIDSFRAEAEFTTWLHAVARNQVLMFMRNRKSRKRDFQISLDDPDVANSILSVQSKPVSVNENICLNDAIRQLPNGYRQTFLLHDVVGLEHEDVAKIMGRSIGTSKSQLSNARRKLRRLVNKKVNPRIYQREVTL